MRTTLTLEPDVAAMLQQLTADGKRTLKEVVNSGLRAGLPALESKDKAPREPYRMKTVNWGKPTIDNLDNIGEVLAILEGEDYK